MKKLIVYFLLGTSLVSCKYYNYRRNLITPEQLEYSFDLDSCEIYTLRLSVKNVTPEGEKFPYPKIMSVKPFKKDRDEINGIRIVEEVYLLVSKDKVIYLTTFSKGNPEKYKDEYINVNDIDFIYLGEKVSNRIYFKDINNDSTVFWELEIPGHKEWIRVISVPYIKDKWHNPTSVQLEKVFNTKIKFYNSVRKFVLERRNKVLEYNHFNILKSQSEQKNRPGQEISNEIGNYLGFSVRTYKNDSKFNNVIYNKKKRLKFTFPISSDIHKIKF